MILRELLEYKQWMCWSGVLQRGRYIKLPLCPMTGKAASCTDPATWGSYRQARASMFRRGWHGIGFVFTADDPYLGVDLDHCRQQSGEITPWAEAILASLRSYSEISPSSTGIHIIVKATLPSDGRRRTPGLEMYDSGRYFTVTAAHLDGTPTTIERRQDEINRLQAVLVSQLDRDCEPPALHAEISKSDEDVLSRARRARNASKFVKLWAGDLSEYGGDHSRADAALCSILAFYTNGNASRVDRLFRNSGLHRDKWDRPTAGSTYGWITIASAIEHTGHMASRESGFRSGPRCPTGSFKKTEVR
jgi:primase-polymerase (primpol)-like protein